LGGRVLAEGRGATFLTAFFGAIFFATPFVDFFFAVFLATSHLRIQ
jgi:hypothetical protein